ncbi:stimulator of interferon genes protein [Notolabrus celidotus]|uniref:stimulator of interferon genes protein n=1 Tax=Notolabrus celidotus TaxID=1203425 RepID=UPI001490861D|nr:stimulator of interferon genes protein [Notolabrus celidotus]
MKVKLQDQEAERKRSGSAEGEQMTKRISLTWFTKIIEMISLQDQEALIPQPRGALPKVNAVVLAAITIGGIMLLSPESIWGWIAMVTLILTLGPLLHGICLLTEEMLHHSNTRYRSRGLMMHMLSACGLVGKSLLTAVLAGLLLSLVGHPLPHDSQCLVLIILASALYTLFKSLGVLSPSEVEVSDICEGRKMNVAHGLAWSFHLGYLHIVLPHLEKSIASFRSTHQASSSWGRGSRKLLILIPLNSNISHKLEDEDNNISFYDNLPNTEIDRAGVRGRVYKHSVYRVMDEHGKAHECVCEYATPLLTMYRMSHESSAGFGEYERRQQVLLFYRTLHDILENSLECRNRYTLILLNDKHEDDPHFLSKTILRHLQQQEKEEFCLTPPPHQEMLDPFARLGSFQSNYRYKNGDRHHSEPMSREPTLQMSMERPQSLKGPEECTDHFNEKS